MYNIVIDWPRRSQHHADEFKIHSREVWQDDLGVVFRGWGTRATITSEARRVSSEFPDCVVRAFWTPDELIDALEYLGLWRVAEALWSLCEKRLCLSK